MSLDPMPNTATLLRMKADRERRGGSVIRSQVFDAAARSIEAAAAVAPRASIAWPVTLTLPWSTLVSDNKKFRAQLRGNQAIMIITRPYAEAETRIRELAMSKLAGAQPAAEPLQLVAHVWMPDNRIHDLTNSCKLVHDALQDSVYADDRWLYRVTWERAGVDVDQPRAEITITPMSR